MDILDISRDILKAPVYPGDPEGYLDPIESLREGGRCNLSAFYTCLHAATHIDAPLHFIDGGAPIDRLPLDIFIGECIVVETPPGPITGEYAEKYFPGKMCERLLIKGNGLAYLMESSAYYVSDSGVKLVGTDSPSIGNHGSNAVIHKALLGSGTAILEGLDLSNVKPGRYFLLAQPLKLSGTEAAPCRALLIADHLFWTGDPL